MAATQKEEARALSADERELVKKSQDPALQQLSDDELAELVKLVRDRREKAKTQAEQRRREIRGKSAARGATPSKSDEGSRLKVSVLAAAVQRLNDEVERRRQMAANNPLVDASRRALAMKQASEAGEHPSNTRYAREGMRKVANKQPQNLVRPMELGRQRKAASVAQAKRDGR